MEPGKWPELPREEEHRIDRAPLVSMVMATNRVSPWLDEALESMAAQTYGNLEIIVIDDGCSERERLIAMVNRYADTAIHHQKPAGVSAARNVGVSLSRGELIGFFDDDDRYPKEWVERHVGAHRDNPGTVLSYGGVRVIDEDGRELSADRVRQAADMHEVLQRKTAILGGSMVVQRDAFLRVGGFDSNIRLAEDLDLVLKLAREGHVALAKGAIRDYRTHDSNVTRDHRALAASIDRIVRAHLVVAQREGRKDLVRDHRTSLAANNRYAAWSAARTARTHLASGEIGAAVREIFWAARFAPSAPFSWARKRISGRLGGRAS